MPRKQSTQFVSATSYPYRLPLILAALLLATTCTLRTVSAMTIVPLHCVRTAPPGAETSESPLLVMVHGLDSSSHTWTATIDAFKQDVPCLAVDQRGCGFSELGQIDDFSQDALVEDLHEAVRRHGGTSRKVMLLGHSLGGRIVMGYAAKYPSNVAACIIEDMDIEPRQPTKNGYVQLKPYESPFDRRSDSKESLTRAFVEVGYPASSIDRYIASGRMGPDPNSDGGAWWSQINPDFRKFCYPHVLSTEQGKADCKALVPHSFPCHVLVAGTEGTVCIEDSVQEMKTILGDQLTIHRYPDADHSIHGSDRDKFYATIRSILQTVQP